MAKVKHKTKKAVAKRVKVTGSGKLKMKHAYRSHMAHSKTTKQKRQLRKDGIMHDTNAKKLSKTLNN